MGTKYDQFDFLIDIVPRDDIKPTTKREESSVRMVPDQVSYYFQLAQQHQHQPQQQAQVVQSGASGGVQTITVSQQQPQVIQLQLHSLPRLFRRFNFKEAITCTTSSNSTDFTLPQHSLMCSTSCCQPTFHSH